MSRVLAVSRTRPQRDPQALAKFSAFITMGAVYMSTTSLNPSIYHITHVANLPNIIANGLLSDAAMIASESQHAAIGMSTIKQRRLQLPISCCPGLKVGDCVPFYFCPRSIMLYVIHCANHIELTYRGGQGLIVHLESDLSAVVNWASTRRREWAFSLSNAGARYAQFRNSVDHLDEIDWGAVASNNFANNSYSSKGLLVKEGKQAEFLLAKDFPWSLVRRIGVHSQAVANQVQVAVSGSAHQPQILVEPSWYF